MHINTFSGPIHHAQQLVSHFYDFRITRSLLFSNDIFKTLLQLPINQPICGFYYTDFPLWKLGYLLDENWVEEDVINAAAELCYFCMFAQLPTGAIVNHFFLPKFFSTELELCFHDGQVTLQLATLYHHIWYMDGLLQISFLH
ncbi:hypothetical protein ARMSODRAFT_877262 [Armillaria solidipes]|uniref:Uncharacterized protein n=1 Tax=Armillaria solidipes TaxID=1076256 RepID=A0A2H3C7Z1_9AGAR|nr:hypothetical protein ARMSODRAFT_877262 [Armillaria solidipes]